MHISFITVIQIHFKSTYITYSFSIYICNICSSKIFFTYTHIIFYTVCDYKGWDNPSVTYMQHYNFPDFSNIRLLYTINESGKIADKVNRCRANHSAFITYFYLDLNFAKKQFKLTDNVLFCF